MAGVLKVHVKQKNKITPTASPCIIEYFKLRHQIWGILNYDPNKMTSNNTLFLIEIVMI